MAKLFQSYVIIGPKLTLREKTKKLAGDFGIDIEKPSPDNFIITKEKDHVTIDQVRTLKEHVFQKPLKQTHKFIIFEDAQTLTPEAQNALLKILEEPPRKAVIVLEAQEKSSLLPTILSRCSLIALNPQLEKSENALELNKNLKDLLEDTSKIEDPKMWLDSEIKTLHKILLADSQTQNVSQKTIDLVEKCAQTKKMIASNVNPKFALINLVFDINLASN